MGPGAASHLWARGLQTPGDPSIHLNFTVKGSYDGAFMHQPSQSAARAAVAPAAPATAGGNFRWVVCALLFFAATINYIDRQVIGILTTLHHISAGRIDYFGSVRVPGCYAIACCSLGRCDRSAAARVPRRDVVWASPRILHAEATVPRADCDAALAFAHLHPLVAVSRGRFRLVLAKPAAPGGHQVVADWFRTRARVCHRPFIQARTSARCSRR